MMELYSLPHLGAFIRLFRMRVVNAYLFKTVGMTFVMALVVVTFTMLMGTLVSIFELIFKKFSILVIGQFMLIVMPSVICYALPFSMAAASLLVFSRLSADGEITAMKANGISVFRIAAPPLVLSLIVALVASVAYNRYLPRAHFMRANIVASYDHQDPSALIETGKWTPMGKYRFFVDVRDGSMYRNISIIEDFEPGRFRLVEAKRGFVKYIRRENRVLFELYDVRTEERSPEHTNSFLRVSAGRVDMYLDMSQIVKKGKKVLEQPSKIAHFTTAELEQKIHERDQALALICKQRKTDMAGIIRDIRRCNSRWSKLQRDKFWRALLKERDTNPTDAFVDIVGRNLFSEYEEGLQRVADGKSDGVELLRAWYKEWPQAAHNALEYRSYYRTEINYRFSYAFASIAFAIIGIPLGIRAHRSERTIGFLICLALIAVHYAMVITVKAFNDSYFIHPEVLIWLPDALFVSTGLALLWHQHRVS
jgi:lipopolysaccharide export LptBFGC system permease protein LptF